MAVGFREWEIVRLLRLSVIACSIYLALPASSPALATPLQDKDVQMAPQVQEISPPNIHTSA